MPQVGCRLSKTGNTKKDKHTAKTILESGRQPGILVPIHRNECQELITFLLPYISEYSFTFLHLSFNPTVLSLVCIFFYLPMDLYLSLMKILLCGE